MKSSVQISRGIESLFGTRDENIRLIENGLNVRTRLLNDSLEIEGDDAGVARAAGILNDYAALMREGHVFNNGDLNSFLRVVTADAETSLRGLVESGKQRSFGKKIDRAEDHDAAPLRGRDRASRSGLRHRPGRNRQNLSGRGHGASSALLSEARQPHRSDPARGGSRRAPGIPARNACRKKSIRTCARSTTRCTT